VRAGVSPATRAAVEDALGIDWLPGEMNLEVTRAVYRGLGPEGGARFFRLALGEAFSGPLLRIVVEAALRVFRVDAASFAEWLGKGWVLVFQDCGHWIVDRVGAQEATLRIEALPPAFVEDVVWLGSVAHALDAFFDVARATGRFRLEEAEPAEGRARYRMSWSRPAVAPGP